MSKHFKPFFLNKVELAGNLTRDPELRYLPSGDAVCKFGLAVSRPYKKKDGEAGEETIFVNVKCWRQTAEFIGEHSKKGDSVFVEGSLSMNEWEDRNTGQKRSLIEVECVARGHRVETLTWPDDGGHSKNAHSSGGGQESIPRGKQDYESGPKPRVIEEPIDDELPF